MAASPSYVHYVAGDGGSRVLSRADRVIKRTNIMLTAEDVELVARIRPAVCALAGRGGITSVFRYALRIAARTIEDAPVDLGPGLLP